MLIYTYSKLVQRCKKLAINDILNIIWFLGFIEQKGKRTHGHGQQYDDSWEEGHVRGLNGNGKKYNKDKINYKMK